MGGRSQGTLPIRDRNLIDAQTWKTARHCDQRHAGFSQFCIKAGRCAAGGEDQATHPLGTKQLQTARLLIGVLIVISQKQRVVSLSYNLLNPANYTREKWILDVWNQNSNRAARTYAQVTCGAVRVIGE